MKLVQEIQMLQQTVDRKELSTSSSTIEGEGTEERMMRKTRATVRQDTQEVSTSENQAIWLLCVHRCRSTEYHSESTTPSQSEIDLFYVIVNVACS